MPKVEIVAKPNRPPDLSKVTDLRLRVVDEDGKPLSKLEAMVHTAGAGYGPWVEGHDGMVFLGGALAVSRGGPSSVGASRRLRVDCRSVRGDSNGTI